MPKSLALRASVSTWMRLSSSLMPWARSGRWRCCGRPRPASCPARAPCGRPCAGPRTPAGSSPRARDGGRYRGRRCRPAAVRPRGPRRSCRRASWARIAAMAAILLLIQPLVIARRRADRKPARMGSDPARDVKIHHQRRGMGSDPHCSNTFSLAAAVRSRVGDREEEQGAGRRARLTW